MNKHFETETQLFSEVSHLVEHSKHKTATTFKRALLVLLNAAADRDAIAKAEPPAVEATAPALPVLADVADPEAEAPQAVAQDADLSALLVRRSKLEHSIVCMQDMEGDTTALRAQLEQINERIKTAYHAGGMIV